MERFKTCLFDDNYLIGDSGTVKSTIKRTIFRSENKDGVLKGLLKDDGYKLYWLNKKWYYAHRLVAMHFCRNPNDWKEVNHLDGVKGNNNYKNLEWTTRQLNQIHMRRILGRKAPSGRNHWSYGVPISDHAKKLMSDGKKGVNHPKFKGYYCFNGVKYTSLREIVATVDSYPKLVAKLCRDNADGFSFEKAIKA